jgi:hypothetical protein
MVPLYYDGEGRAAFYDPFRISTGSRKQEAGSTEVRTTPDFSI